MPGRKHSWRGLAGRWLWALILPAPGLLQLAMIGTANSRSPFMLGTHTSLTLETPPQHPSSSGGVHVGGNRRSALLSSMEEWSGDWLDWGEVLVPAYCLLLPRPPPEGHSSSSQIFSGELCDTLLNPVCVSRCFTQDTCL